MAIGVIMIGLTLIAGYNFFKSFSDYFRKGEWFRWVY